MHGFHLTEGTQKHIALHDMFSLFIASAARVYSYINCPP